MSDGIDPTTLLSTPMVRSASDLIDWFKRRPNQFFTKKMLLDDHGFSSNVGRNLTELVTRNPHDEDKLWRIRAVDITNSRNKKQQSFFGYIVKSDLDEETYQNLLVRADMDTSSSPPKKSNSKKTKAKK